MRHFLLVTALSVVIAGCGMAGYGPPVDRSRIVSTASTPDGRLGVFSHHRLVYRPASGWRAFPDGGIPRYVKDIDLLGILDMQTGDVRVVSREKNREFQPGQGEYYVSHVSDGKAVITRGGQLRSGTASFVSENFMLDLATGVMEPLPLKDELASHGRGLAYFYLVDSLGTLVFVTPPLGADTNYVDKESNPKGIWIRHPDGRYEKAADAIHYYPTSDGLVHYFSTDHRYLVYDPATGGSRIPPGRYPPTWDGDNIHNLAVSPDDPDRLSIVVHRGDDWEYRDAGVEVGALY
ncbi:MAG TPA: hypothetical protein VGB23_04230 [Nitrospirota bacterium]